MPTPKAPSLGPKSIRAIHRAVDEVFDRAKVRLLGPQAVGKRIYVGYTRQFSLPGIFESAAREEGAIPNLNTLHQVLQVAGGYIDSTREKTKARVVKEVQSFLQDAVKAGVDTDLKTVLGGKLTEVWSDTAYAVRRIVDAEANHTKNIGVLDGIIKINNAVGIEDPLVYFVVVRDRDLCDECKRLHMMPDGRTPRVWRMSQIGSGYHKKGEPNPKMGGLHPHCRCTLVTLMPGFGFNDKGFVTYIARDHDQEAHQGKLDSEAEGKDLKKMAIADLTPGKKIGAKSKVVEQGLSPDVPTFDYSHMLTPDHTAAGYRLMVTDDKMSHGYLNGVVSHQGKPIGQLKGRVNDDQKSVNLEFLKVGEPHQKKGLGLALNEALLTHAKHVRGLHTMVADYHSSQASATFSKLAQKHGISYTPVPKIGRHSIHENEPIYRNMEDWQAAPSGAFDGKYEPFESTIKAEDFWFSEDELKKFHPTPKFTKLGITDNRRETPITAPGPETALKAKLTTTASFATPAFNDMNPQERKAAANEPLPKGVTGAVSMDINRSVGFAAGTPGSDRDSSTKLHEDFHLMMHRVEQKYGHLGRQLVAKRLVRAIDGGNTAHPLHTMYNLITGGGGNSAGSDDEEKVAHTLNYLNSSAYRNIANQHYYGYTARNFGFNFTPDRIREYHLSLKRGYEKMRHVAENLKPELLRNYAEMMQGITRSRSPAETPSPVSG